MIDLHLTIRVSIEFGWMKEEAVMTVASCTHFQERCNLHYPDRNTLCLLDCRMTAHLNRLLGCSVKAKEYIQRFSNQSRAKHDVSPPWPCQGRESGYFLAGLHMARQGLTGPARPCDKLWPCAPAGPAIIRRAECLCGGSVGFYWVFGVLQYPLGSAEPSG